MGSLSDGDGGNNVPAGIGRIEGNPQLIDSASGLGECLSPKQAHTQFSTICFTVIRHKRF